MCARSMLARGLLIGMLIPTCLPAGTPPVISAENLNGPAGITQPELLAISNLDQRIAAATDAGARARLELQRDQAVAQATRAILTPGGQGLVPAVTAAELRRLGDAVSDARRGGDQIAEMTSILQLNIAVLDQGFGDLLTTDARAWVRFAPPAEFSQALSRFAHRTTFNQAPFARAVRSLQAAAVRSPAEDLLIANYDTYTQRVNVYHAVLQSLQDLVKTGASGNRLLKWLGISGLIGAIDARPWVADVNRVLLPGGHYSLGLLFAAAMVYLVFISIGLLLPWLWRLLRRVLSRRAKVRANAMATIPKGATKGAAEAERFLRLLQQSFQAPLRAVLLLVATALATRILFLREFDEGILVLLGSLYVLLIVWALLRLIDNFFILYSTDLLQRYPTLRGELVNFLSNTARFVVIVIAALYLMQRLGYNISSLLASLGIGGLAVAFAAKETIANIFGCISIIVDDMFRQGDWIVTPNGEGTVIDIGLRSTKIRTFDNAVIFLPNAYVVGVDVRNWSRRKLGRRIKFTLGLEYGSDMQQVRKTVDDIRAMLTAHKDIADSSTDTSTYTKQQVAKISDAMDGHGVKRMLLVYLDALGESSIDILIYCFSKTVDWQGWLEVKEDVIYRCCAIVEANGLAMPFPSRTLYLRKDAGHSDSGEELAAAVNSSVNSGVSVSRTTSIVAPP